VEPEVDHDHARVARLDRREGFTELPRRRYVGAL
jgi:hypothetical protein